MVVLTTGCDHSPTAPSAQSPTAPTTPFGSPTSGRTVRSLEVVGPTVVSTGETAHYKAFAQYSDGTSADVINIVHWSPVVPPGGAPDTCLHSLCFTGPGVALGVRPGESRVSVFHQAVTSFQVPIGVLDPGTFEVTGVGTESGGGPLLGATIEVTTGIGQTLQARTDTDGRYGIYGVAGQVQVRVSAEGFTPHVSNVVVAARVAIHTFELTPLEPATDVSGIWTLTIAPSPVCRNGLPEIARGREYRVEFVQLGTRLQSRISGPSLTVLFPQPKTGAVLGSRVRFQLPGDTSYGDFNEATPSWVGSDRLSSTEQFGFAGTVDGVVSGSAIRGTLDGDLLYFNSETHRYEPSWYCRAQDHSATLRR
jgi:hypothetical protein